MPKITLIAANGEATEIDAALGRTLMELAVEHGISGIVGECGGSAMCATCHVYVESSRMDALSAMRPEENAMLDSTISERRPNSRLSCQIKVTNALDGALFHLPEHQV